MSEGKHKTTVWLDMPVYRAVKRHLAEHDGLSIQALVNTSLRRELEQPRESVDRGVPAKEPAVGTVSPVCHGDTIYSPESTALHTAVEAVLAANDEAANIALHSVLDVCLRAARQKVSDERRQKTTGGSTDTAETTNTLDILAAEIDRGREALERFLRDGREGKDGVRGRGRKRAG